MTSESAGQPIGQGSDSARDLEILIRSRYPAVTVDTLRLWARGRAVPAA